MFSHLSYLLLSQQCCRNNTLDTTSLRVRAHLTYLFIYFLVELLKCKHKKGELRLAFIVCIAGIQICLSLALLYYNVSLKHYIIIFVYEFLMEISFYTGHNYIGSEHLLLGLLREGEGVAARVLESLGADPSNIRTQASNCWRMVFFFFLSERI